MSGNSHFMQQYLEGFGTKRKEMGLGKEAGGLPQCSRSLHIGRQQSGTAYSEEFQKLPVLKPCLKQTFQGHIFPPSGN